MVVLIQLQYLLHLLELEELILPMQVMLMVEDSYKVVLQVDLVMVIFGMILPVVVH